MSPIRNSDPPDKLPRWPDQGVSRGVSTPAFDPNENVAEVRNRLRATWKEPFRFRCEKMENLEEAIP